MRILLIKNQIIDYPHCSLVFILTIWGGGFFRKCPEKSSKKKSSSAWQTEEQDSLRFGLFLENTEWEKEFIQAR